jgi:type IV pilus assembly protein PilM
MNLLPKASGTRPRVACEITPQGVVAGRSAEVGAPLGGMTRVALAAGAVSPGLKPGNIVDRVAVTAALAKALDEIGLRANSRGADLTLIVPDAAVRVLLLEFDALPNKLSEALPIVRFRLKKLLPFDADEAMVTFQVMSTSKSIVRVLAVAIPRDVLSEYETVAREAGYEPGCVIPSTLAALAAVEDESASLLVNANSAGVTTAIVRSGIVLLHRSVDMQEAFTGVPANMPPAMFEPSAAMPAIALPLVDVHETAGEWAAQQPLPEHGRNPYETAPVERSPYASPLVDAEFNAEMHNSMFDAPTSIGTLTEDASGGGIHDVERGAIEYPLMSEDKPQTVPLAQEIAQAVNVAAAYFEDTLAVAPREILSAGPLGADALGRILAAEGVAQSDGLRVRELVQSGDLLSEAVSASVPRAWLSGVLGALRG